jgi:hypothetical protein
MTHSHWGTHIYLIHCWPSHNGECQTRKWLKVEYQTWKSFHFHTPGNGVSIYVGAPVWVCHYRVICSLLTPFPGVWKWNYFPVWYSTWSQFLVWHSPLCEGQQWMRYMWVPQCECVIIGPFVHCLPHSLGCESDMTFLFDIRFGASSLFDIRREGQQWMRYMRVPQCECVSIGSSAHCLPHYLVCVKVKLLSCLTFELMLNVE